MPRKSELPEDEVGKAILQDIFKKMATRLDVGGVEYGDVRWMHRELPALLAESTEELIDYLNWRVLTIARIIHEDMQMDQLLITLSQLKKAKETE